MLQNKLPVFVARFPYLKQERLILILEIRFSIECETVTKEITLSKLQQTQTTKRNNPNGKQINATGAKRRKTRVRNFPAML